MSVYDIVIEGERQQAEKDGLAFYKGSFMLSAFSPEEVEIFITELSARPEKGKKKVDQRELSTATGAVSASQTPAKGPSDIVASPSVQVAIEKVVAPSTSPEKVIQKDIASGGDKALAQTPSWAPLHRAYPQLRP